MRLYNSFHQCHFSYSVTSPLRVRNFVGVPTLPLTHLPPLSCPVPWSKTRKIRKTYAQRLARFPKRQWMHVLCRLFLFGPYIIIATPIAAPSRQTSSHARPPVCRATPFCKDGLAPCVPEAAAPASPVGVAPSSISPGTTVTAVTVL